MLTHAEEYALIFGIPIPGYHAPMEISGPAAATSMSVLIQGLDAAYQDGKLAPGELAPVLGEMLQPWTEKLVYAGPPAIIHIQLSEPWYSYRIFDWQKDVPWTNNGTEHVIGHMKMRSRTVCDYKSWPGMHAALLSGSGVDW
jgi:hypothetical protein